MPTFETPAAYADELETVLCALAHATRAMGVS